MRPAAKLYQPDYFAGERDEKLLSPRTILPLIKPYVSFNSAVDFGCGTASWLAAAKELGAADTLGVDGPWIREEMLADPSIELMRQNIEEPIRLDRRFDLAMSFEAAEHLSPERADSFVEDLCSASDAVLFSAAVPHQGGKGHINEQWQSWWAERFARHGYRAFDVVRSAVWANPSVRWWYAQNIVLYLSAEKAQPFEDQACPREDLGRLDLVHPRGARNFGIIGRLKIALGVPGEVLQWFSGRLSKRRWLRHYGVNS